MLLSNLEIQYGPDAKDLLGDPESMVESRYGIRCYCPGPPGRLRALSVFLCESAFYGTFVWARRALNSQKRRFPARAVTNERIIFVDAEPDNGARISKESVPRQVRTVWTLLTLHQI
jgi:hypothetical protein